MKLLRNETIYKAFQNKHLNIKTSIFGWFDNVTLKRTATEGKVIPIDVEGGWHPCTAVGKAYLKLTKFVQASDSYLSFSDLYLCFDGENLHMFSFLLDAITPDAFSRNPSFCAAQGCFRC